MKKAIALTLLVISLCLMLMACGTQNPKIEDFEWQMHTAMQLDKDSLAYTAGAESSNTHPEASVLKVTLLAKDGKIVITDATNNKTYNGTYTVSGKNPKGTDYRITFGGETGYATVAYTTYLDGTQKPTLPITLGDYSICFYAD